MAPRRKLRIGMSLAPTWLSGEAWRRPDSGVEGVMELPFSVDIAQRSEAAKMDFVFRPDTLFLNESALGSRGGFAGLDATVHLAALAGSTSRIGLLTTISTTFAPPYIAARQLQSLHRLSQGRAGWNVVTALDGARNFGMEAMASAEARYARATEYVDLVRALWAGFPADALAPDRASGRYADPSKVRAVAHEGAHFQVAGPLNVPAHPARLPLIQAGASDAGRNLAACIADAVFAASPDRDAAAELRADLRRRAQAKGRDPEALRVLPGLSLYLAPTRAEARDLFAATHARDDRTRRMARVRELIGLDLETWPEDRPVREADLPPPPADLKGRTHAALLRRLIARDAPRPKALLDSPEVMGSAHWQVVGTPEDAAEAVADWAAHGAIDGFIALPGGSVDSLALVFDELTPRLVDKGLFRKDYSGRTFVEHLEED